MATKRLLLRSVAATALIAGCNEGTYGNPKGSWYDSGDADAAYDAPPLGTPDAKVDASDAAIQDASLPDANDADAHHANDATNDANDADANESG